jgi:hypothetical protein
VEHATLLRESVMSWRIAMLRVVAATAIHVGLRIRLRIVAATKNSRPKDA